MAVFIGKRASHVSAANAMSYVFGYTNFIDGSARGLLPAGNTFYQMKSRDTFAPLGPYLVTADEMADPHQRQIRLWVNGTLKQNFNTNDMAHKIPRCIEWVTSIHTLEPGDVLATGTNHRGLSALPVLARMRELFRQASRLAIPFTFGPRQLREPASIRNATCSAIETPQGAFLLTADHVLVETLSVIESGENIICRAGCLELRL